MNATTKQTAKKFLTEPILYLEYLRKHRSYYMKTIKHIFLLTGALWVWAPSSAGQTNVAEGKNVQIQEFRIEADPSVGIAQVVGIARNLGATAMADVFIEFNLYDERGILVGNAVAHGMNLAPGGWWKFSAQTATRFHRAEITKITAYR